MKSIGLGVGLSVCKCRSSNAAVVDPTRRDEPDGEEAKRANGEIGEPGSEG